MFDLRRKRTRKRVVVCCPYRIDPAKINLGTMYTRSRCIYSSNISLVFLLLFNRVHLFYSEFYGENKILKGISFIYLRNLCSTPLFQSAILCSWGSASLIIEKRSNRTRCWKGRFHFDRKWHSLSLSRATRDSMQQDLRGNQPRKKEKKTDSSYSQTTQQTVNVRCQHRSGACYQQITCPRPSKAFPVSQKKNLTCQ